MTRFVEALERRGHPRVRRRLACKLLVEGRAHSGVVRDLSADGLFVWTRRLPTARQPVLVAFQASQGERFVLEASVPRRSQVPHSLAAVALPGVGLHLQDPSPDYLSWVAASAEAAS